MVVPEYEDNRVFWRRFIFSWTFFHADILLVSKYFSWILKKKSELPESLNSDIEISKLSGFHFWEISFLLVRIKVCSNPVTKNVWNPLLTIFGYPLPCIPKARNGGAGIKKIKKKTTLFVRSKLVRAPRRSPRLVTSALSVYFLVYVLIFPSLT